MTDTSKALVTIEKLLQKIGQLTVENDALREMLNQKQKTDESKKAEE
jgi:cell shape-determining protein MreC